MPPKVSLKAKLARGFLNFLDEHGDYRTQLEETAARAAAAEANSLLAKDRWGRKKKKRKKGGRGKLGDADYEEGEWEYEEDYEELPDPKNKLPDDPYEQIQFYFHTFKQRTSLQIQERIDSFKDTTRTLVHEELHHETRVPALSGTMLLGTLLLWALRERRKKIGGVARIHGILGKKLQLGDYLHSNILRGRILIHFSVTGKEALDKMRGKARQAESAALASMRPYQRKKYERLSKLEKIWEKFVSLCLILGIVATGGTLVLSLDGLVNKEEWHGLMMKGDWITNLNDTAATMFGINLFGDINGTEEEGEVQLDGHIYSLDGPTDSDGYPIGMRELAEEQYATCVLEAEENGVENPSSVCDVSSFFDEAVSELEKERELVKERELRESQIQKEAEQAKVEAEAEVPSSPLRTKINDFLTTKLHIPPSFATYLTTLQTQTIAYLSSVFTFLLFILSHYIAHKLHMATMRNDPMKHFVLAATDKSVKADGTVSAKRGETEAQRKKRERMMQAERMKSQMAQLAMEAKQKVEARRRRIEGAAAVEKEKEEEDKKVVEELEEIVKNHGRQYMMIKAGVPDGAIMNSFLAEGIDDEEEQKEIIAKLRAIKVRRSEEARKAEEEEEKKLEEEKKAELEKERVAAERLRMMKRQGSSFKASTKHLGGTSSSTPAVAPKNFSRRSSAPVVKISAANSVASGAGSSVGGGGSIASTSTITTNATDPSMAKSNMLAQIGKGSLKKAQSVKNIGSKNSISADPSMAKSNMLSQIGKGGLKKTLSMKSIGSKNSASADPTSAKSNMLSQIGTGGLKSASLRKTPKSIPSNPAPRPGSSTIVSGNMPVGVKSEKRWDRDSKTWVTAVINADDENKNGVTKSPKSAVTPLRSNITSESDATPVRRIPSRLQMGNHMEEEKKGEEEPSPLDASGRSRGGIKPRFSKPPMAMMSSPTMPSPTTTTAESSPALENGNVENDINSEASPELVLVRISSSPDIDGVNIGKSVLSEPHTTQTPNPPDVWGRRMSVNDIRATITAVENAPEEEDSADQENEKQEVDLAPGWLHSQAFEAALRTSNSNWDSRGSSRDVMATIRAVEMAEAGEEGDIQQPVQQVHTPNKQQVMEAGMEPSDLRRSISGLHKIGENSPAIDKRPPRVEPTTSFEFRRPASKNAGDSDDDEISALSEPTYHSLEQNAFKGRSIPSALFVPQKQDTSLAALSPMVSSASLAGRKSMVVGANMDKLMNKVDKGEIDLPPVPSIEKDGSKDQEPEEVVVEETEEQIQRRKKAEARAKKMEAISARREAGKDVDDESSAAGSKRYRMRRSMSKKKKAALQMEAQQEEASIKSDAVSQMSGDAENNATPKVETEDEKQRRMRAEKRAKKMEAIAARREAGGEDDTQVSGISRRHRLRRKKSALLAAAISPKEQERIDWKKNIYSSVLNAEKVRWKRTIYGTVLNAEATRKANAEAKRELDELNAAAKRRIEHKKKLDKKAKKFASRAERFHMMRRQESSNSVLGDGDDGGSVVSSASRMRRRRVRKSSSRNSLLVQQEQQEPSQDKQEVQEQPVLEEPSPEEKEECQRRQQWCSQIYSNTLHADQNRWKRKAYANALNAENARNERLALEAQIAKERAAAEAQKDKKRKSKLRARKMERMMSSRDMDDDDMSVVTSATTSSNTSALKKMRSRRRKAAKKKTSSDE